MLHLLISNLLLITSQTAIAMNIQPRKLIMIFQCDDGLHSDINFTAFSAYRVLPFEWHRTCLHTDLKLNTNALHNKQYCKHRNGSFNHALEVI